MDEITEPKKYIGDSISKGYSLQSIEKMLLKSGRSKDIVHSSMQDYKKEIAVLQKCRAVFADDLRKFNKAHVKGQISAVEAGQLSSEKIHGKTREEWLSICEKRIPASSRIPIKPVVLTLLLIILIGSLLILKPSFSGYATITQTINYSDKIDITRSQDSEYVWLIQHPSPLNSIGLSGSLAPGAAALVYIEVNEELYTLFDSSMLELVVMPETTPENGAINLDYGLEDAYDSNNDGVESESGIIDVDISGSTPLGTNMCTVWGIRSIGGGIETKLCYGAENCCLYNG